ILLVGVRFVYQEFKVVLEYVSSRHTFRAIEELSADPMKLPPLLDSIGNPVLTALVVVLLLLQWRFPLRHQQFSLLRRLLRNYVLSIPGFVIVRLAMLPIPFAVAVWAQHRHIGLLSWLGLRGWIAGVAGLVLLDYAYWWWHWANHMLPFFWRFHNVH